jgi:hypothetical protein
LPTAGASGGVGIGGSVAGHSLEEETSHVCCVRNHWPGAEGDRPRRPCGVSARHDLDATTRWSWALSTRTPSFVRCSRPRGRPAEAPWRLALVSVMQFADELSARQPAERCARGSTEKYLLGLELADPGFDASILSEFRARLILRPPHGHRHLITRICQRCEVCRLKGS